MQRLVLKYLHTVSQAVNFHLAEIIGHVRASDKYESVLKFSEDAIKQAQTKASIFWAKGIELQQVNNSVDIFIIIKFIYSEKATKFCDISTLLLSVCTVDKSKVKISQNFVAFSEYTNLHDSRIYLIL